MFFFRIIKLFKSLIKSHKVLILLLVNFLLVLFLSLIIGAALSLSFLMEDKLDNQQMLAKFFPAIRAARKLSDIIYLPYYFMPTKLPTYQLEAKKSDLEFLNENLPPAYSEVNLTNEYKKEVPAKLIYQGKEYQVEVRYSGQHSNHWSADKKSWLIKVKGGELLEGKSELNLILPYDRQYLIEHLANFRAKKLGILASPSRFIKFKVNGKSQGVYFEVENWTGEFIERDNEATADSDIFGFDLTANRTQPPLSNINYWKKYIANPLAETDFGNLQKLIDLLDKAADEKFFGEIGNILDLDSFYRWQINHLLLDSFHGRGPNLKLYFNKDTGKFELISWDVSQADPTTAFSQNINLMVERILKNPEFVRERNKILWDYVKDDKNLTEDLAYYDKVYQEIKADFYKDRLKIKSNLQFDWEVSQRRKQIVATYNRLQAALGAARVFVAVGVDLADSHILAKLDFDVEDFPSVVWQGIELELEKFSPDFVFGLYDEKNKKLADLIYNKNSNKFEANNFERVLTAQRKVDGRDIEVVPTHYQFFIKDSLPVSGLKIKDISLATKNYVTDKKVKSEIRFIDEAVFAHFEEISDSIDNFILRQPIFRQAGANKIVIGPGTYNISQTVVVPKNLVLEIRPGTTFLLGPKAAIVSYSQVLAAGTAQNPIVFKPVDGKSPWGVMAVVGEESSGSIFDFCQFELGADAYINGIYFSGQLAIHDATAKVTNSKFGLAQADDALNIKYGGESLVANNYFYENSADAIDFDWTDGKIEGNYFYKNGNDGIDISGHAPVLLGNIVNESGDKCISLGENTKAKVVNNLLNKCVMGIAVKDLSAPEIINNTIVNNETGVAVYEKKPIFGGGSPVVANTIIWGNKTAITLDGKSKISINNSDISGGYKGKNNLDQAPEFVDPKNLDYRLKDSAANQALLAGGNLEALKKWVSEIDRAVMGIYSFKFYGNP